MPKLKTTTILLRASDYEDEDDCLSAAASDVANEWNIASWQVTAEWADESRQLIALTLPVGPIAEKIRANAEWYENHRRNQSANG